MENSNKNPILFIESIDNIPAKGCDIDLLNSSYEGCKCLSKNKEISCSNYNNLICECFKRSNLHDNYDFNKRLNVNFNDKNWHLKIYPINECNEECLCDEINCQNRVVQLGSKFNFKIIDCNAVEKGKGLITLDFIPMGSFVIEYIGEIIGVTQANELLKIRSQLSEPNYIMFLKEFYLNKDLMQVTVLDARNYSNMARFINHSCVPNLFVLPVRINNLVPHAALFSLRDIQPGEELSYDYNGSIGTSSENGYKQYSDKEEKKIKCYCDSINCKKYLPDIE